MPLIVAFRPAANTATRTTSARPTISAAAVTAVRCGWRIAFSRASTPVRPWKRAIGAPSTRAKGRTSSGARNANANIISTAPRPISEAAALLESSPPNRPMNSTARPAAASRPEPTIRIVPMCFRPGVTASRMAVTGSTRVARSAGTKPETIVATSPMARPMITVIGETTMPVVPRSIPAARIRAASAGATTSPASTPRIEASRPIANVSISTEFRTCRREAPSTRSSANSLVRWATVTVNVLKIKKPPTSNATPAKISSAIRMKPSALGEVLRLLLGGLLARAHEEVAPEFLRDRGLDRVRVLAAGRDRDRVVARRAR